MNISEINSHLKDIAALSKQNFTSFKCYKFKDTNIPVDTNSMQYKLFHFVRHGQGTHNVMSHNIGCLCPDISCPYVQPEQLDAHLTALGRDQATSLWPSTKDPKFIIDCMLVSPLSRAIETALIAFESHKDKVPIIANEDCREQFGRHICDKRRGTQELGNDYPEVNFSLLVNEDPLFSHTTREPRQSVVDRAYRFMKWAFGQPGKSIAVITHSAFLLTLFNVVFDCEDPELKTWFKTAEMRSIIIENPNLKN